MSSSINKNSRRSNNSSANGSSSSNRTGKSSSNTTSSAPPCSGDTTNGFALTNGNLRSFLTHPIGILMTALLNDTALSLLDLDESWNDFISNLNLQLEKLLTYRNREAPLEIRDNIFSTAVSNWNTNKEKELTAKIMEELKSSIENNTLNGYEDNDPNSLTIESEKRINDGKGIPDFLVAKKKAESSTDDATKRSVVMIVEFGISHNIWWAKMNQMLLYVEMLCEDRDDDLIFDQPILITIITVNKREMQSQCSPISEATSVSDANNKEANPTCGEKLEVRFGVFLCTRRHNGGNGDKYRVALLWRKDTFCVTDASIQFGKMLYAAQMCASLREHINTKFMKPNSDREVLYQYLGPNCCRIGDSVSKYSYIYKHILRRIFYATTHIYFFIVPNYIALPLLRQSIAVYRTTSGSI